MGLYNIQYYNYGENTTNTTEHADFFLLFELFSLRLFDQCNMRKSVFILFIYALTYVE